MKSIALVYRKDSPDALTLSEELSTYLKNKGVDAVHSFSSVDLTEGCFSKLSPIPESVLVLGGDGTYLSASRALINLDIPLVGVNLGSLGFLTDNKSDEVYSLIDKVLSKQLKVCKRSLLEASIFSKGKLVKSYKCLNDVVVERGARAQLVRIKIFSENHLISDLKADGLIVSTATGSTAYSLAAGGPILFPETKAFVVTPVAPHSLTSRPIVLPEDHEIRLQLAKGDQSAQLTIDGQSIQDIDPNFEIILKKSTDNLLVLKDPFHNYFDLLREKLKFGERS
ncbi:MAG: NAD(+)/NADH kinase [Bdellovibrionales bacterium]